MIGLLTQCVSPSSAQRVISPAMSLDDIIMSVPWQSAGSVLIASARA
nr:hypothetical protein [Massilia glaciei]